LGAVVRAVVDAQPDRHLAELDDGLQWHDERDLVELRPEDFDRFGAQGRLLAEQRAVDVDRPPLDDLRFVLRRGDRLRRRIGHGAGRERPYQRRKGDSVFQIGHRGPRVHREEVRNNSLLRALGVLCGQSAGKSYLPPTTWTRPAEPGASSTSIRSASPRLRSAPTSIFSTWTPS